MNIEEFKQKVNVLDSEQKYDEILALCDNQLAEINSESADNKEFLADIYHTKRVVYNIQKEYLDRLGPLMRPNAKEYTKQKISSLPFNVSEANREFISSLADQIWLKSMYIALAEYSTNEQNYKFLTELILDEIFLHFVNLKNANFPQESYNRILSEALWSTTHVAAGNLTENTNFEEVKNMAHEAGLSSFLREARTLLEENLITQENYDKLLEIPELKEYQAKYDKEILESLEELQKKVHNPFVIVGDLIMYGIVYPILRVLKNISKKLNKKG